MELLLGLVVLLLPAAWFSSEFGDNRPLRICLGMTTVLGGVALAFVIGGELSRLNYNAWYGAASKSLVQATLGGIEEGDLQRIVKVLRRLDLDYEPTYENRAHYDELVQRAVADMKGERELPAPEGSEEIRRETWAGHWESDTGFWLVVSGGTQLQVVRSGEEATAMQQVQLSDDNARLTFQEADWSHELTLAGRQRAEHVWRERDTGEVWKTETLHRLTRTRP